MENNLLILAEDIIVKTNNILILSKLYFLNYEKRGEIYFLTSKLDKRTILITILILILKHCYHYIR